MKQERFFQIIEAYGAKPERWPDAERADAEAFVTANPDLAAMALAEARELDAILGPAEADISDLLERRILQGLPELPAAAAPRWIAPAAVAASLLVGVFIGFASGALTVGTGSEADAIYAEVFGGFDEDWVDWLGGDA